MEKSGITGKKVEKDDALFTGSYFRSLDSKGRLLLPPSFLRAMSASQEGEISSIWISSFYGRLSAYRPCAWNEIVRQLCKISLPSPSLANFKTKLIGLAEEMIPDSQGRIRLSRPLAREAGLEKDIVLVGMLDKFEIWSRSRFEALEDEDVSAELLANGLNINL